jgi:outer membrane lipoprotein carrier protein
MKKVILSILICFSAFSVFSQTNPEAENIINQFSAKIKKYSTIKVKFVFTQTGPNVTDQSPMSGEIYMKGDKFKMIFPGNEIYCDGQTLWQYMKELQEVTITNKDKNDESIITNPKRIFTIYKDEFKFKLNKEYQDGDKTLYEIDLFPKNLDKSNYSRIRLHIEKENLTLHEVKYFGKDGTNIQIEINEFISNQTMNDTIFIFDTSKFPNVEINDMR